MIDTLKFRITCRSQRLRKTTKESTSAKSRPILSRKSVITSESQVWRLPLVFSHAFNIYDLWISTENAPPSSSPGSKGGWNPITGSSIMTSSSCLTFFYSILSALVIMTGLRKLWSWQASSYAWQDKHSCQTCFYVEEFSSIKSFDWESIVGKRASKSKTEECV